MVAAAATARRNIAAILATIAAALATTTVDPVVAHTAGIRTPPIPIAMFLTIGLLAAIRLVIALWSLPHRTSITGTALVTVRIITMKDGQLPTKLAVGLKRQMLVCTLLMLHAVPCRGNCKGKNWPVGPHFLRQRQWLELGEGGIVQILKGGLDLAE